MNENNGVEAEKRRLQAEYDRGMVDGSYAVTKPLPTWYFQKTLQTLTAYERGYWFGREIAIQENL